MEDTVRAPDTTHQKQVVAPAARGNLYCWAAGGLILVANKIRHSLLGYLTPRTFPMTDFNRAIRYDFSVVGSWRHYLNEYAGTGTSLHGRTVLELGPGADLGTGLLLLAHGAERYCAMDVNNLVASVPQEFYTRLFARIENDEALDIDVAALGNDLESAAQGTSRRLNYVHDPNFDLMRFKEDGIDIIFSQAAFEHFDDVRGTFAQLTEIVRPGAILIAEIDLSTHTRWIRDFDPLNIYRYSDTFYRAMSFPGSPNRLRPHQYQKHLEDLGWKDVRVIPRRVAGRQYVERIINSLPRKFRAPAEGIGDLSVILCATR